MHVIAPEQGLTQPGMTIACGDSHTSTHGAFGAIAFGIGTSQVRDVLASQTLALGKLKVRRIEVNGELPPGVFAKDIILHIIRKLGVKGGVGYAYEFAGSAIEAMSMEGRMTLCNMAIEGGARCGYVNPDQTTYDYLRAAICPTEAAWDEAVAWWQSLRSDADADYDDVVEFSAADIAPTVTWGITPGQGIGINETIPPPESHARRRAACCRRSLSLHAAHPWPADLKGTKIDVCFIGSCTNGRISDLREAAKVVKAAMWPKG